MRKFIFLCMTLVALMFAGVSCMREASNLNFNQTTVHNADFSGILEAIKSKSEAKRS